MINTRTIITMRIQRENMFSFLIGRYLFLF